MGGLCADACIGGGWFDFTLLIGILLARYHVFLLVCFCGESFIKVRALICLLSSLMPFLVSAHITLRPSVATLLT